MDVETEINKLQANNSYRTGDFLNLAKKIYYLEINNVLKFSTEKYDIYKHHVMLANGKQRSYLIKINKNIDISKIKNCIFFFHGSRDLHWDVAMVSTNLLSDDFIVVYLQGHLNLIEPTIHEHYNYVTYGENFWEIRDFVPQFDEDIEYIKLVKFDIDRLYGFSNYFAIGHSNGGVFVCLLPIYLPGFFKAVVSHQGGMGYDQWFYVPFEKMKKEDKLCPIYFYTGEYDIHKDPSIQAHNIFNNEGWDSTLYIEPGLIHKWNKECESKLLDYFRDKLKDQ